jgi:uncharacterized repeat protein (TIGR03803 family)
MSTKGGISMTNWKTLALCAVAMCAGLTSAAQASRYEILYRFGAKHNASYAQTPVVVAADGTIYGTTEFYFAHDGPRDAGTIFALNPDGQENLLWRFYRRYEFDGYFPIGNLIVDPGGSLIGATQYGGSHDHHGQGVIFSLQPDGSMIILKTFGGINLRKTELDGLYPAGGLVENGAGVLYGATVIGGDIACVGFTREGCGLVFELNSSQDEVVLHSFAGGNDGASPSSGLIMDGQGNLYGTTEFGGSSGCGGLGCGTIYKVSPDGQTKVLYRFMGASDGKYPSNLSFDRARNLFGTAAGGLCCGTVFKLGSDGTFTTLYQFSGGTDGSAPVGNLVSGSHGVLYGTTSEGGSSGLGTVFKVEMDGSEKVLHSFAGGSDGSTPEAGLTTDESGNLYGTTVYGGRIRRNAGIVFKLTP